MKHIVFICFLLLSIPIKSQLIFDKWGDIVPFSQSEKYRMFVNVENIHSMIMPSFNNDSLFRAANDGKSFDEAGSAFAAGFDIDTLINLRKKAKRFTVDEGFLWLYTIESPTAKSFIPRVKKFDIPEGAYLSFITVDFIGHDPVTFTKESTLSSPHQSDNFYGAHIQGRRLIIEYFEPKEVVSDFDILLNKITYYYAGYFNRKSNLKSGIHGQTTLTCQHDVVCESVAGWLYESNSVGLLQISYSHNGVPSI